MSSRSTHHTQTMSDDSASSSSDADAVQSEEFSESESEGFVVPDDAPDDGDDIFESGDSEESDALEVDGDATGSLYTKKSSREKRKAVASERQSKSRFKAGYTEEDEAALDDVVELDADNSTLKGDIIDFLIHRTPAKVDKLMHTIWKSLEFGGSTKMALLLRTLSSTRVARVALRRHGKYGKCTFCFTKKPCVGMLVTDFPHNGVAGAASAKNTSDENNYPLVGIHCAARFLLVSDATDIYTELCVRSIAMQDSSTEEYTIERATELAADYAKRLNAIRDHLSSPAEYVREEMPEWVDRNNELNQSVNKVTVEVQQ